MARYKLLRLVSTFDKEERIAAERYLAGLNRKLNGDSLRLFRQVKKLLPQMEKNPDIKRLLYNNVFSGQEYDDARMRKLMNRLLLLLEEFLIQRELARDEACRQELLARSLSRRNDFGLFREKVENRLAALEGQRGRGAGYFFEKYKLQQALYFHPHTSKYKTEFFRQALQNQELYFILSSLISGAECLVRNRTIATDDTFLFLETALEAASTMGEDGPEAVALFKNLVLLLRSPKETVDLPALKKQLHSVFDRLDRQEQGMALKVLIFYTIPFTNNGNQEYRRFAFELYRFGIEKQLLTQGGNPVEPIVFMNIATTAFLVGEFDWSADFLEKYSEYVPDEDRENALHLCRAGLHYHKGLRNSDAGEFHEALRHLSRIPVRSKEMFEHKVRSLQLRINFDAFEIGALQLEDMLEQARNFERFLKKNATYSDAKKDAYLRFLQHCRRLARLYNHPEKKAKDIGELLQEIKSDDRCILRHWLEEKAEALLSASAEQAGN